jgi:hypothetical protein
MAKAQTITVTLTEPQYEALRAAVILLQTTFEMDGPSSVGMAPQMPGTLDRAWDYMTVAWQRAVDGF